MANDDPFGGLIPDDPVMAAAWIDGLRHAIGDPDMMAAFRHDTGCNWRPATDVLGRMIDREGGAERDFIRRLVAWYHENVWGPD